MIKILVIINNRFTISELESTIQKSLNITYHLTIDDAYKYIIENDIPDILIYEYGKDNQKIHNLINYLKKPPLSIVLFPKFDELLISNYVQKSFSDFFILSSYNLQEFVLHLTLLVNNLKQKKESYNETVFNEIMTSIRLDNNYLKLTRLEYNLFKYLFIKQNEVVTRKEIQEHVWKFDEFDVFSRSIDTYIKQLRKKMSRLNQNEYQIVTIHGKGYSLIKNTEQKSKQAV